MVTTLKKKIAVT